MESLIPGYEYDIFISYRQKDNKHDGWVTEFVNNLKGELESTFKEEVSVYFDINPHDGLLETHDVDASLKNKLKCLVFIPVISRTYCDPKSFAWEHEFKAFVEQALRDQFGLKVKLPNGNVANRVLPIRIYDLDTGDIKLCESILGSVLRSVDFIYKSTGVNRPLRANEDHPQDNLNRTYYRDQINKVANSIKEIITAIGQNELKSGVVQKEIHKSVSIARKSNKTKIIAGSLILLALIVLGFYFLPKLLKSDVKLKRTIAILPFININPSDTNNPIINGISRDISGNLQSIKDLSVVSQYSADKYKDPSKYKISEISKDLNVNYLVTGSGQKYKTNLILRVELIDAVNDRTLWSKPYQLEIKETKDIFSVQSQIAQSIAAELKAVITPEEKRLIEKVPTTNLTALDFYQRGREEEGKFPYYDLTESSPTLQGLNPSNTQSMERAEKMYKEAVKCDSTFALAYTGLSGIYWRKNYYKEYFSGNFLDSVLKLANKALSFDNQLPDAYYIRGMYYSRKEANKKQALENFNKALKLNPNYWLAYYGKGYYCDYYLEALQDYKEAASHNHGSGLSGIFKNISFKLSDVGFSDLAKNYSLKAIKLESDSAKYYFWSWMYEFDYKGCFKFYKKLYSVDSTNNDALSFLSDYYEHNCQFKEALKFFKAKRRININEMHRVGYAYWKNGFKDSADYYFNKQIEHCYESIRLDRSDYSSTAYYDLAGVYAFKGDKIKAYENLKLFNQKPRMLLWIVRFIKYDPLFDSLRNEQQFQNIMKDMDAKYQAEHERVKKWLEEQGML